MIPGATYTYEDFNINTLIAIAAVAGIEGYVEIPIPDGVLPSGNTQSCFDYLIDQGVNQAIANLGGDYSGTVDQNDNYLLVDFSSITQIAQIHVNGCNRDTYIAMENDVTPDGVLANKFNAVCNLNADIVSQALDPNSPNYDPELVE